MRPYGRQLGGFLPLLKTCWHAGRVTLGMQGSSPDGTPIADKSQFCTARPGAKDKIRAAKRSFNKRVRQQLKRDMLD